MSLISASGRRRRHMIHLLRHLSTATTGSETISVSEARSLIRHEFNPDKVLSIISSLRPNPPTSSRFVFDLAVRRLARSRRHSDIHSLLRSRVAADPTDEVFLSSLILSYGTGHMLDHAIALFEELPSLGSPRTIFSFNAVLSAALKAKLPARVPDLFTELSEKHSIMPDVISYSILMKSFLLSNNPKKARETLIEMEKKGIEPTTIAYTTVLDSLYKEGKPHEAEGLWAKMVEKGCVPDFPAYNVRVSYLALHGELEEVLGLIAEMKAAKVKPTMTTWNYLIACYCKHGQYEEGKKVYKSVKGNGRCPNAAMFENLLPSLLEAGDFDFGLEVFNDSVKCNKVPELRMVRPFVEGLVKASRVEDAKNVIGAVTNKFPDDLAEGWKELEKELGLDE